MVITRKGISLAIDYPVSKRKRYETMFIAFLSLPL
jgi:hypothetical protein